MADPLAAELKRKAVHIGIGGFALALRWLTPWQAALAAAVALLFNLFLLHRVTRRALLREEERAGGYSLGIALYPAAVLALIVVFRGRLELAAAVWGLIAFGDGMAAVAGVLVGGPRLPWNPRKSWAGLFAFVLNGGAAAAFLVWWTQLGAIDGSGAASGAIGASFLADPLLHEPLFLLLGAFLAAAAAGFAESLETGLDDNFVVPLVGGAVLYAATLVRPAQLVAAADALGANLIQGAVINAALALAALASRGVGRSGAIWGWVLGTTLYTFAGWPGFLMLVVFFALGTGTTKLGYARKAALGIAQERGGRRGARNAFANAGAGVACAVLAVATPYPELFTLGLVAAFATATCDTVSSEIGQAYGRRHFLITTLRRVRPGTDGAVSVEGTLAGLLAGAALSAVAWAVGLLDPQAAVWAGAGAFIGATFESYLGATAERAKRIDNELINFTNTVVGALAAGGLHAWLGG